MENTREILLDLLLTHEKEGTYSNRLIKDVLDKYDYLDRQEKAFIKRVAEGTLERRIELDYQINAYSKTPVGKMKPLIRCLLRMSAYQIFYMESVPDSAAINEAVKLAKKRHFDTLSGFVNGVLRKLSANKEGKRLPDKHTDSRAYLSVRYSMPEMIVAILLKAYGEALTEEILEASLAIHPVTIRVKGSYTREQREALFDDFSKAGVIVTPNPYSENCFQVSVLEGVEKLPGFEEGAFCVQDVSSQIAVQVADIQKNQVVADACGAPGGKTMLAAEKAKKVYCFDVAEHKLIRMEENFARMQLDNIETEIRDAREPREDLVGKIDVLLLDVPCSGLGIMGKKRDIKYRFDIDKMPELYELQKQIVDAALSYVRPGGLLLYSTCTLNPRENTKMTEYILSEHPFAGVSLEDRLPETILTDRSLVNEKLVAAGRKPLKECEMLCLPGTVQSDGFYFALFRKKEL